MSMSFLQVAADCDNFPYPDEGSTFTDLVESFYTFSLLKTWAVDCNEYVKVGYIRPNVIKNMPWLPNFHIDHSKRDVSIKYEHGSEEVESRVLREQLVKARGQQSFAVLAGWRNELYPVFGIGRDVRMERAGSALFGILTVGVHMTGYVRSSSGEMKIWVPRRAKTKQTYGGMLDQTVAGGIAAGEDQFESVVREAGEEASLPEDFVRKNAKACGTISYFHVRDSRAGGESGLLQPETQYVYDLEMPADLLPKPSDDEVEEFYLWTVDEAKRALKDGQFKPNCAACLIDFLIRHGEITASNEGDYLELVPRLHRRIRF